MFLNILLGLVYILYNYVHFFFSKDENKWNDKIHSDYSSKIWQSESKHPVMALDEASQQTEKEKLGISITRSVFPHDKEDE